jgi:hypothetical protein
VAKSLKKKIAGVYRKSALIGGPAPRVSFATNVALRSRGGLSSGYLNKLNRLSRRTPQQLKGVPTSGPRLKDN